MPRRVVTYTAIVGLRLEYARIRFDPSISRGDLARVLAANPPQWKTTSWPPPLTGTDADLSILALSKLKANLDFTNRLSDGTALQMESAIQVRFPGITSEEAEASGNYKRFPIEAEIWEDGSTSWGYEIPEAGEFPPGFEADPTGLEIFLRNVVRADLQARLEALGSK